MKIVYEDNHLLVVNKPAGQLVQGDSTRRTTLLEEAKEYLREKYNKPGNVFLGLVHRLDRPASGVVVLARTSKAASRLSEEFRCHRPYKTYWALVEGEISPQGHWTDRLERNEYQSSVVQAPAGKEARLGYRRLHYHDGISMVEITLETGRHHQIRVQFAHHGFPLLGDKRYGSKAPFASDTIALHARQLEVEHPTQRTTMKFSAEPGSDWQRFVDQALRIKEAYWLVYRLDDNDNRFMMADNLTENEADKLIRDYQQRGHKQIYFKEIQDA